MEIYPDEIIEGRKPIFRLNTDCGIWEVGRDDVESIKEIIRWCGSGEYAPLTQCMFIITKTNGETIEVNQSQSMITVIYRNNNS